MEEHRETFFHHDTRLGFHIPFRNHRAHYSPATN